jgi:hypothetical protein
VAELFAARGLFPGLGTVWAMTDCITLREAFASDEVVFSRGGIGATPDDHTRQRAACGIGGRAGVAP